MKVKCNACGYEWISNKDNEELPKACHFLGSVRISKSGLLISAYILDGQLN